MMESTTMFGSDSNGGNGAGEPSPSSAKASELLSSLLSEDRNGLTGRGGGRDVGGGEGEERGSPPPVGEEADADLFGSLADPIPPTTADPMGIGHLLGGDVGAGAGGGGVAPPSEVAPPTAAATPPSAPASILSCSGLLDGSAEGNGLFNGVSGGGGGDGLFDGLDAEEEEIERQRRMRDEEARRREEEEEEAATRARAMAAPDVSPMQDLNLNDGQQYMGGSVGGGIAYAPPPVAAPPVPSPGFGPGQQQDPLLSHPYGYGQQQQPGVMNAMAGSYYYSTSGAGQMHAAAHHRATPQPSVLAGMHVGHDVGVGGVAPPSNSNQGQEHVQPQAPTMVEYPPPPPFDSLYGEVFVDDPLLIQASGLFAGPPHWTYLVTLYAKRANGSGNPPKPTSAVRRRFRHFVALEDRLRTSVPGAILPPRPDKHPTRAIEEGATRQSSDFAGQRARELTAYMKALVEHPHAGPSQDLRLFLTLQDHIGTAWPEVSSSAFTRITAVGSAAAERLGDTVDGLLQELGTAQQVAAGEDSAEILALAAREGRRIGAVTGSVPKIEGAVISLRERGDRSGATGLEMSKLAKDVSWCDRELAVPLEVLASALLRSGRRTKRLGLELAAAAAPFAVQYRTCRYEQMAFADRRAALKRRTEARVKADGRAARLINQSGVQGVGRLGALERMEMEAAMTDEAASEAAREADEVAERLRGEVARIGAVRVLGWNEGMKVMASSMKEACAENASIWEGALEAFGREFPDINISNRGGGAAYGSASVSVA